MAIEVLFNLLLNILKLSPSVDFLLFGFVLLAVFIVVSTAVLIGLSKLFKLPDTSVLCAFKTASASLGAFILFLVLIIELPKISGLIPVSLLMPIFLVIKAIGFFLFIRLFYKERVLKIASLAVVGAITVVIINAIINEFAQKAMLALFFSF